MQFCGIKYKFQAAQFIFNIIVYTQVYVYLKVDIDFQNKQVLKVILVICKVYTRER